MKAEACRQGVLPLQGREGRGAQGKGPLGTDAIHTPGTAISTSSSFQTKPPPQHLPLRSLSFYLSMLEAQQVIWGLLCFFSSNPWFPRQPPQWQPCYQVFQESCELFIDFLWAFMPNCLIFLIPPRNLQECFLLQMKKSRLLSLVKWQLVRGLTPCPATYHLHGLGH